MGLLPAIILNLGLIVFVGWVIIWLIDKTPPESGGCAQ